MECVAESKSILGGNSRIERKLVPIRERVTRFETEASAASLSSKMLKPVLHANSESRRGSHFNLLPEKLSRRPVTKCRAFISSFEFEAERRPRGRSFSLEARYAFANWNE